MPDEASVGCVGSYGGVRPHVLREAVLCLFAAVDRRRRGFYPLDELPMRLELLAGFPGGTLAPKLHLQVSGLGGGFAPTARATAGRSGR